jgi:hypothetical protein
MSVFLGSVFFFPVVCTAGPLTGTDPEFFIFTKHHSPSFYFPDFFRKKFLITPETIYSTLLPTPILFQTNTSRPSQALFVKASQKNIPSTQKKEPLTAN